MGKKCVRQYQKVFAFLTNRKRSVCQLDPDWGGSIEIRSVKANLTSLGEPYYGYSRITCTSY